MENEVNKYIPIQVLVDKFQTNMTEGGVPFKLIQQVFEAMVDVRDEQIGMGYKTVFVQLSNICVDENLKVIAIGPFICDYIVESNATGEWNDGNANTDFYAIGLAIVDLLRIPQDLIKTNALLFKQSIKTKIHFENGIQYDLLMDFLDESINQKVVRKAWRRLHSFLSSFDPVDLEQLTELTRKIIKDEKIIVPSSSAVMLSQQQPKSPSHAVSNVETGANGIEQRETATSDVNIGAGPSGIQKSSSRAVGKNSSRPIYSSSSSDDDMPANNSNQQQPKAPSYAVSNDGTGANGIEQRPTDTIDVNIGAGPSGIQQSSSRAVGKKSSRDDAMPTRNARNQKPKPKPKSNVKKVRAAIPRNPIVQRNAQNDLPRLVNTYDSEPLTWEINLKGKNAIRYAGCLFTRKSDHVRAKDGAHIFQMVCKRETVHSCLKRLKFRKSESELILEAVKGKKRPL